MPAPAPGTVGSVGELAFDAELDGAPERKWVAKRLGRLRGFSAHSMRATFITRALENGCPLEHVQKDVGHAHPSTTQMYDHRGDNDEEAATFLRTTKRRSDGPHRSLPPGGAGRRAPLGIP